MRKYIIIGEEVIILRKENKMLRDKISNAIRLINDMEEEEEEVIKVEKAIAENKRKILTEVAYIDMVLLKLSCPEYREGKVTYTEALHMIKGKDKAGLLLHLYESELFGRKVDIVSYFKLSDLYWQVSEIKAYFVFEGKIA